MTGTCHFLWPTKYPVSKLYWVNPKIIEAATSELSKLGAVALMYREAHGNLHTHDVSDRAFSYLLLDTSVDWGEPTPNALVGMYKHVTSTLEDLFLKLIRLRRIMLVISIFNYFYKINVSYISCNMRRTVLLCTW